MFSVCKELHPPTGVEMVTYCHFFDRREKNLVVAGTDIIRVYRFVPDIYAPSIQDETKPPKMKMECMGEYRFFGNIMAMESMPLSLARDALLLSFKEAKLSIVEYDPDVHDLRTISLHYFETDDLKGGSMFKANSMLRVDPEGRCAALLVYGRHLVIIPFQRRDTVYEEQIEMKDVKPNVASLNRIPTLRSYTIDLKELDERVDNVIDFKFLHGYYEPTIIFLYEPIRTYVGRVSVRQDTCCLVAVSLNVSQKVHPCIWTVSQLPYDCCKVLAVPKPIGGVLVFSQNCLIYLNQSIPPYATGLNSLATKATNFPMRTQEGVVLTLDCAQADFLSHDRVILSLKGGQLYVLTLLCDAMRSVRGFHLDKAASSVLTCCICICDKDYVFLGSRLGNSLLLSLSVKGTVTGSVEEIEGPNAADQNGGDRSDDVDMNDSGELDEHDHLLKIKRSKLAEEEVEVYGSEKTAQYVIKTFSFEVCDSLLNVGPCGNMTLGEPAFLSDDFTALEDPDLELVTTSGHAKNGALCVLQRSIRPQIVTTIPIPSLKDLWTVFLPNGSSNHGLIVVSQEIQTIILQTGEDINQIHRSGFKTDSATIFTCNIGNFKYIAQVYQEGIRLLNGTEEVQCLELDLTSPIVFVSTSDPYLVLLTMQGQVILVTLIGDKLVPNHTSLHKKSQVVALSCYCDTSGLFTTKPPSEDSPEEQIVKLSKLKKEARNEDDLLYGNPDEADNTFKQQQSASTSRWWRRNRLKQQNATPTHWLVVARETAGLEILTLPDLQVRFAVKEFGLTPRILGHSTQREAVIDNIETVPKIHELLLVGLGNLNKRPFLFARSGEDLVIYEAYPYYEDTYEDVLKLRFAKVKHNMILREKRTRMKDPSKETALYLSLSFHFRHFPYLGGYSGVFICGAYPHWVFMTTAGQLRFHPMGIDSKILAFAPFSNPNCPQGGFIYCNADYDFRICMLPKHLSYDAPWPIRKVPLRCTPHFITYHMESKCYVVALSTSEYSAKICRIAGDEKEYLDEQKDERFPLPTRDSFSVRLFSSATWEAIPDTSMEMEPFETILCLKIVDLAYEGARSGLRGYLAIGTNYSYGEDQNSRGRVLIVDVIEVEPEPGQPLTKTKCKTLYAKEQKGPVTAVCSVMGFLCAAVGQKVYLWQFKDDLVGIAFIDTQIYIHQMFCIKNLIFIADVYKSVSLLRFQENHRTLAVVSRDFNPLEVYGISFLIDNTQLGLIASDIDQNICLFMYQPQARESFGGYKLIRKADFHLGQSVTSWVRVKCKVLDPSTTKRNSIAIEKRQVSYFCTLDGGLGYLLPVSERTYRRLLMLQNVLVNILPHRAALNPKSYRTIQTADRSLGNPAKGIIDGELVWEFINLAWNEKTEICKKIGSKVDEIFDDLMEIDRISAHF